MFNPFKEIKTLNKKVKELEQKFEEIEYNCIANSYSFGRITFKDYVQITEKEILQLKKPEEVERLQMLRLIKESQK